MYLHYLLQYSVHTCTVCREKKLKKYLPRTRYTAADKYIVYRHDLNERMKVNLKVIQGSSVIHTASDTDNSTDGQTETDGQTVSGTTNVRSRYNKDTVCTVSGTAVTRAWRLIVADRPPHCRDDLALSYSRSPSSNYCERTCPTATQWQIQRDGVVNCLLGILKNVFYFGHRAFLLLEILTKIQFKKQRYTYLREHIMIGRPVAPNLLHFSLTSFTLLTCVSGAATAGTLVRTAEVKSRQPAPSRHATQLACMPTAVTAMHLRLFITTSTTSRPSRRHVNITRPHVHKFPPVKHSTMEITPLIRSTGP